MRQLLSAALASLALAACGGPGGYQPPANQLGPGGGVISAPNGLALGAPASLLTAPLAITLKPAADPGVPLPAELTPQGGPHRVSADRTAAAPNLRSGFVLGLPVPEGAPTANLGVAVLGKSISGPLAWSVRRGRYEAAKRRLLVVVPAVLEGGLTYRLVSADFLSSPDAAPPGAARARTQAGEGEWPVGFEVERAGAPLPRAEARDFVRGELETALERYKAAGFQPAKLETNALGFLEPVAVFFGGELKYVATVKNKTRQAFSVPDAQVDDLEDCVVDARGQGSDGVYYPDAQTLTICAFFNADAFQADREVVGRTAYHELFHAVQSAYLPSFEGIGRDYFVESTAALAEGMRLGAAVQRSPDYGRRVVDRSLLLDEELSVPDSF